LFSGLLLYLLSLLPNLYLNWHSFDSWILSRGFPYYRSEVCSTGSGLSDRKFGDMHTQHLCSFLLYELYVDLKRLTVKVLFFFGRFLVIICWSLVAHGLYPDGLHCKF